MKSKSYQTHLKIFFWIFFGVFSLGQLQRFELSQLLPQIGTGGLYLHEVLMVLFVFRYSTTAFSIMQKSLKNKFLKTLLVWLMFSTAFAQILQFDAVGIIYVLRLILYLLFSITTHGLIQQKKIEAQYFHFQVFSVGIFTLLLGFLQYLLIPDTRFLSIFGWDDHYARLIGTYFDPGFTGLILTISLFLGLAHPLLKKLKLPVFIIHLFGIALTFSRASYLTVFLGVTTLLLLKFKNHAKTIKYLVIFSVLFLFLIALIPKPMGEGVDLVRTASITARSSALKKQIQSLDTHTLLVGNGMFGKVSDPDILPNEIRDTVLPSHSRVPDNMFITILLYAGFPGLILFLMVLKYFALQYKNNPWFIALLVSFIAHAQFANSLLQPFTQLMLLLSGIVFVNIKTQKYT